MSGPGYGGPAGAPEVHTARSKLDGVLQTLMEKKEDSPVKEEFRDDFDLEDSAPVTPSKRSKQSKQSRKRKRGEEAPQQEYGQYHHTYVMKLFDRSVDLAQFEDVTPLYPVCRAWMKNQPQSQHPATRPPSPAQPHSSDEDSDADEDEMKPVYSLPPPQAIKTETGLLDHDLRVPSPLPPDVQQVTLDDIYQNPAIQPAPEQLLLSHMDRWKTVRQKWKDANQLNEARYTPSLSLLKQMYDQSCKDG